jgi:membrane-associated phospholipid phosphatase
LVGVSIAIIDRPVATFMHERLGDARFDWFRATYEGHLLKVGPFTLMAMPAEMLGPLAGIVFAALAIAALVGWRPKAQGRIALALCLSVFAAIVIGSLAKEAFGRTWPESWQGVNPSWIRDGVFGFFPFHRGGGFHSFPSGHTTVITALATIMWLVWPELRVAWIALVAIVVVGLIGANYHFVSDIIGGLYLGAGIGLGTAGSFCRRTTVLVRRAVPDNPSGRSRHEDPRK